MADRLSYNSVELDMGAFNNLYQSRIESYGQNVRLVPK